MSRIHFHFASLVLLSLILVTGCQSSKVVAQLGNGYVEVDHAPRFSADADTLTRTSFEHKSTNGQTVLIWPSLYGATEVVNADLALFVGDRLYIEGGGKVIRPRLFAVKFPELPLDITDEVLWSWSKVSGNDFARARQRYTLVSVEERRGQLILHLEFFTEDLNWPDKSALQLNWGQMMNIMDAVKTKGVLEKDIFWHQPFIGEEF